RRPDNAASEHAAGSELRRGERGGKVIECSLAPFRAASVRLAVHGVPAATANHHIKAARVAIERTTRSGMTSTRNPEASGHGASDLGLWLLCLGMVPGGGVGGRSDRGQHSGDYKDRLHCFNLSCSLLSLRWQR